MTEDLLQLIGEEKPEDVNKNDNIEVRRIAQKSYHVSTEFHLWPLLAYCMGFVPIPYVDFRSGWRDW